VDDQPPIALGGTLQPRHAVYVSVLQHPPQTVDLLIRDPVDHDELARILDVDTGRHSGQYTMSSERALREAQIAPVRWFGRRFELQGWALVGLSSLGILAFMGLWVRSLVGEIAVRRSVGARRYQILRWIVLRALAVASKGIVAGLWFGISMWGTLPAAVTGALTWDPSRFLPYAALIVGVVLCGVMWPAWRVSRTLPAELLQSAGS
jgi:predicted lysophospholipase L1 biosynthesis ABC-type transport system permease subunit